MNWYTYAVVIHDGCYRYLPFLTRKTAKNYARRKEHKVLYLINVRRKR